ncbi:MAG TPA: hypothetical protein VF624_15095 [Tepidisphaeraceae bacterium]|jgi:hypothetical protein
MRPGDVLKLPWRFAMNFLARAIEDAKRASGEAPVAAQNVEPVVSKFGGHHAPGISSLMRSLGR